MKKWIGHIPLLIISILMIYCVGIVMTSMISLSYEHYIGFIGLFLSILLSFIRPRLGKFLTAILLILGTFVFAAFTPVINYHTFWYRSGETELSINVQPYCVLLFILFVLLNIDFIKSLRRKKTNKIDN
jgi:hypothetical protein